jgi:hypothetical protein
MWQWVLTYFGAFAAVFASLLIMVELAGRWARSAGGSDLYLSGRWVRELNGE